MFLKLTVHVNSCFMWNARFWNTRGKIRGQKHPFPHTTTTNHTHHAGSWCELWYALVLPIILHSPLNHDRWRKHYTVKPFVEVWKAQFCSQNKTDAIKKKRLHTFNTYPFLYNNKGPGPFSLNHKGSPNPSNPPPLVSTTPLLPSNHKVGHKIPPNLAERSWTLEVLEWNTFSKYHSHIYHIF